MTELFIWFSMCYDTGLRIGKSLRRVQFEASCLSIMLFKLIYHDYNIVFQKPIQRDVCGLYTRFVKISIAQVLTSSVISGVIYCLAKQSGGTNHSLLQPDGTCTQMTPYPECGIGLHPIVSLFFAQMFRYLWGKNNQDRSDFSYG